MKFNSLILKLIILISCSVWGATTFAADGVQIAPWGSGEAFSKCKAGSPPCSYKLNEPLVSKLWVFTHRLRSFEYSTITIDHVDYQGMNRENVMTIAGHLHGDGDFEVGLNGMVTEKVDKNYIKESYNEIKKMFSGDNKDFKLTFIYPGNYVMTFCYTYSNSGLVSDYNPKAGCNVHYYFTVEPDVSGLSLNVVNQDNSKVAFANETYYSPYTVNKLIINPIAKDKNAAINEIKSCQYNIAGTKESVKNEVSPDNNYIKKQSNGTLEVKSENGTSAILNTLLLKPESALSLNAVCTFGAKAWPKYEKLVRTKINIHRNKAQPGIPRFTLNGNITTASKQYANWGATNTYNIGVTTDTSKALLPFETCTINGTTYNYQKKNNSYKNLPVSVNPSEMKNNNATTGDYKNYGDTRDYKGTCEIGKNPDSPYYYYPVEDVSVQDSFSITRFGPRIIKSSDFSAQFGDVLPKGEKVRPGATVTVATTAQLTGHPPAENAAQKEAQGEFPHVTVETKDDENLKSSQCPVGWTTRSGEGCQTELSGGAKQGEWKLQAGKDLMTRTDATIRLYGSNYDGNINSGKYLLTEKKITITPLLQLTGKLQPAPLKALEGKVYHHGRQFNLSASYTLTGSSGGKINSSYTGKLTALKVMPGEGLAAGDLANATLKVNERPVDTSTRWDGHNQPDFMQQNQAAALDHDQKSELQIPLTVTRSSHNPERAFVKVRALGSYTGNNVDVDDEAALQASELDIEVGPDLYPAEEAFHMEVNGGKPLSFSPGQKEPLTLQVVFNSKLVAEKLATSDGIHGTAMKITLPSGLKRAGSIAFICNDSDCNSEVNNSWDGKQQTDILQERFLLEPAKGYTLRIPLMVDNEELAPQSSVTLAMSQRPDIGEDTRARIVTWNSVATVSKPVEKIDRQQIAILPLISEKPTIEAGNKAMKVTVQVKHGRKDDPVALLVNGSSVNMQFKDQQGDIARFTSVQPLPGKADYSLKAQVNQQSVPLAGPEAGDSDPRNLRCTLKNGSNFSCDFHWNAVLPFVSGKDLLSYNALDAADKQAAENSNRHRVMDMDSDSRKVLLEEMGAMYSDAGWSDVISFGFSEGGEQKQDDLPQPVSSGDREQSLFQADKVLPAKGTIKLRF